MMTKEEWERFKEEYHAPFRAYENNEEHETQNDQMIDQADETLDNFYTVNSDVCTGQLLKKHPSENQNNKGQLQGTVTAIRTANISSPHP